jgi:hypothetical protein
LVREYSESDLAELRRELERADDPPLPAIVDAGGTRGSNPTRMEWCLRLADEVRDIVVEEWGDGFAVAADGRAFMTEAGATTEVRRLDADELAALRDAIADTDWPALPDPLAGEPAP